MAEQFHFDPDTYLELVLEEVHDYRELQAQLAREASGIAVQRVLDLGAGTGETSNAIALVYPEAAIVGVDENPGMLARARTRVPQGEFCVAMLQDPLPSGAFDLVVSALAVHHLDPSEKADLFRRIASVLHAGGRFVLADVVVPDDPADAVIPLSENYDKPSPVADQLGWLTEAGFEARLAWQRGDLAVMVADRPSTT